MFIIKNIKSYNFNTNNVIDMYEMFEGCSSLKTLDLSNFNTNKIKYIRDIFDGCSSQLLLTCGDSLIKYLFENKI